MWVPPIVRFTIAQKLSMVLVWTGPRYAATVMTDVLPAILETLLSLR